LQKEEMSHQEIDYTKLNERIVRQAYQAAGMTPDELNKLIEDKVERARQLSEALNKCQAV
jgi:tripartite-type tricarboxylate transporter receptor subunit TctC